jgi:hypothetical protein
VPPYLRPAAQGTEPPAGPGRLLPLYDLRRVDVGRRPKASPSEALEDAQWLQAKGATDAQLAGVACPVALIRPTSGFFPDAPPLIGHGAHAAITHALDVRVDLLLEGASPYSMMNDPYAARIAEAIDRFVDAHVGAA